MAFTTDFTSVTMNGTLADGNEIWSAGFHLASLEGPSSPATWAADIEPVVEDIAALLATMYSSAAIGAPTNAPMTSVKFAHLGTDGKYIEEAIEVPVTAAGQYGSQYFPQATLVTTLFSIKFKDPGKYNRFYLPISPAALGGGWRLAESNQDDYAEAVANTFAAIANLLQANPSTENWLPAIMSSSGAGSSLPVNGVKIGAIVDTQRRRRNKLPEAYVTDYLT